MSTVTRLAPYEDDNGNAIVYDGDPIEQGIKIKFTGSNNRVEIGAPVRISRLQIDFDCDNGRFLLGPSRGVPALSTTVRVGQDSTVHLGTNVSTTDVLSISATEGTTVKVGDDVMFASGNEIRADDGHPIFDVPTGKRVNVSKSVTIGNHVWLGRLAVIVGGANIGDGTVIGFRSLVTGRIPNNCVAVGTPARAIRYDVAWERPHLSLVRPHYKPDASTVTRSPYWNLTVTAARRPGLMRRGLYRLRREAGRARRFLQRRLPQWSASPRNRRSRVS